MTDRISFEPDELSQIFNSFLKRSRMEFTDLKEYLNWRGEILPFLASQPTDGRKLLYKLPFFYALCYSQHKATKLILHLALRNILEMEFTQRIKEIEKNRGGRNK